MAAPLTDESKRLLRMLEDDQWHPLDDIRAKLAETVAPGRALRKYEERASNWHKHNGARVGPELTDEEKIRSGQRTLARMAIHSMKKRYVQIMDTPQGAQIRLRPMADLGELPPRLEQGDEGGPADDPDDADMFEEQIQQELAADQPLIATQAISEDSETQQQGSDVEPEAPQPSAPPGDKGCGPYIADVAQHEEFHRLHPDVPFEAAADRARKAAEGAPVACAFFSEDQVRAIVRAEVEQALDSFQRGMQTWLIHRFAAIEAMVQGLPRMSRNPELDRRRRAERGSW